MTDLETAARHDGPDLGEWPDALAMSQDDVDSLLGFKRSSRPVWLKLTVLNMPPLAVLGAAGHLGYLDQFVADPLLGAWVGGIGLVYLWAVGALAFGNSDLASWIKPRLADLGMLGTLVGFAFVLAAVVLGGDVESTKTGIADLTQGMAIALYTTIAGLGFKLLLDVQMRWCK